MKKILVTGANGYIAKHIISDLYKKKYTVRATVRNLNCKETVKEDIEKHINKSIDIEFVETSLDSDYGWNDAVKGCDAILHTASPFPIDYIKDENELIQPAKLGTLRVLNAAISNSISRVIITSSNAAVYAGNKHINEFDESNWTNIESKGVRAYTKSKTIAEKSAWNFISRNPSINLTTINPVLVWGPGLGNHISSASLSIFNMLIKKEMPMVPRVKMPLVDVRDVSRAHVNSLENRKSYNKRFLVCENTYWFKDICEKLKSIKIESPERVAPSFLIRFLALFDKKLKEITPLLDYDYKINCNQAKRILGFNPIKLEKTLKDTYKYLNSLDS
ncbi:MAG: aldehyde reductase [Candidatus Marinimicrobia bacterium]|nr:aldehyde reductase [Candidatus Neomarinimicrobiota bacterium]|tara:strand:- start:6740 stop:7738 length:999 start_codon:yes stop_codon:yes gene_type:complete